MFQITWLLLLFLSVIYASITTEVVDDTGVMANLTVSQTLTSDSEAASLRLEESHKNLESEQQSGFSSFESFSPAYLEALQNLHKKYELVDDPNILEPFVSLWPKMAFQLYLHHFEGCEMEQSGRRNHCAFLCQAYKSPKDFSLAWAKMSKYGKSIVADKIISQFVEQYPDSSANLFDLGVEYCLALHTPWFLDFLLEQFDKTFSLPNDTSRYPVSPAILRALRFDSIYDLAKIKDLVAQHFSDLYQMKNYYFLALMTAVILRRWPDMPHMNPFFFKMLPRTFQLFILSTSEFVEQIFLENYVAHHDLYMDPLPENIKSYFKHVILFLHYINPGHPVYQSTRAVLCRAPYEALQYFDKSFSVVLMSWMYSDSHFDSGAGLSTCMLRKDAIKYALGSIKLLQVMPDAILSTQMANWCDMDSDDDSIRILLVHYAALDERICKHLSKFISLLPSELIGQKFPLTELLKGPCVLSFMVPKILNLFPNLYDTVNCIIHNDLEEVEAISFFSKYAIMYTTLRLIESLLACEQAQGPLAVDNLQYLGFWQYWLQENPQTLARFAGPQFVAAIVQ